ncbi:hypothetical protein PtB15_5B149 [Puccinia triticina]|nr:hypothetical protein PtB15_5B149 [Puccinia triticina]
MLQAPPETRHPALAQQRDDKQAPDSADRSPVGLDTLSCSTLESVVRPNTATDPREGQYRMGLDPSGYEKQQAQGSTASQPDKFDLFSSTLSPSDPNQEGKFNSPLQQQHTFFASEFPSLVDRITPPDIFIQLDHFDGTPMAHSARDQWLQEGVAPAAVQPDVLETKPSTSVAVSSPSSTSSSSKASGGPSCLPSSIAEARKRSKQMPYSAPTDSANPGGLNNNSNSNGYLRNNSHGKHHKMN